MIRSDTYQRSQNQSRQYTQFILPTSPSCLIVHPPPFIVKQPHVQPYLHRQHEGNRSRSWRIGFRRFPRFGNVPLVTTGKIDVSAVLGRERQAEATEVFRLLVPRGVPVDLAPHSGFEVTEALLAVPDDPIATGVVVVPLQGVNE